MRGRNTAGKAKQKASTEQFEIEGDMSKEVLGIDTNIKSFL
jgi:hypothetical protein